jgi:hypothetical protein
MRNILKVSFFVVVLGYFIFFLITHNSSAGELQQMTIRTLVVTMTEDLDKAMPLINEAGYDMSSVSVKTSIPPLMIASFTLEKKVPYEKQKAILDALEGNEIGTLALKSLIEAFQLDESIEIKDMNLKAINLFLTVPPAVQVVYKK